MKIFNLLFTSVLLSALIGCSLASNFYFKDFEVGQVKTVNVGSVMVSVDDGTNYYIKGEGLRQELVYSGVASNILHIQYREYILSRVGTIIKEAFSQSIVYDISESKLITFRNIKLEIVNANSNDITFRVADFPKRTVPLQDSLDNKMNK